MHNRFFATDGRKSTEIQDSWDFVDVFGTYGERSPENTTLYARVAAAYRAFNLIADTIGGMPFVLQEKSGNEFDNSATWENKVKFLPNPSELLRLNTLSYLASNTIYMLRTSDALGYKAKGLYHAVPAEFVPVLNGQNTDVDHIERRAGAITEVYRYPEDKRLIRMWRLDHTTDLLPSRNTDMLAIMNAAGIIYNADLWIKHFFEGGGVAPTVVGVKGTLSPDQKKEEEKNWSNWLRQLGSRFRGKPARVVNAEILEVKQLGSSVTELKDNQIYRQSIENIAMAFGIPLSLLLSNSANYATAEVEERQFYKNKIIPFCRWLSYEYNWQVFEPLGLRLVFMTDAVDNQQEDEVQRAGAMSQYIKVINECPTWEIFEGMATTLGLELSDELKKALESFYKDKEKKAQELQAQMQNAGVVVGPDGKPIPQKPEEKPGEKPTEKPMEDEPDEEPEEKKPAKWIPNPEQFREMDWWKTLCFRKLKRGEALTFEYIPRYGGLPDSVTRSISASLTTAKTENDIKAAFVVDAQEPETKSDPSILALAEAMNRLAGMPTKSAEMPNVNVTVHNHPGEPPTVNVQPEIKADMPNVIVNVPEQAAPVVNVTAPDVNVTVRPAPVTIMEKGKRVGKVEYKDGKITKIVADDE